MTSGWDTYDRAADAYRAVRPVYPAEVFDRIATYAPAMPSVPTVLEIGAGSGQATRPMLLRGWHVVALEPGTELARAARTELGEFEHVEIQSSRFEDAELPDGTFDLVTSATAWHWVDPDLAIPKAARLLRPNGILALWWNAHVPDTSDPGWVPIRRVYQEVAPGLARLAPLTPDRPDYDPIAELTAHPCFTGVEHDDFPFTVDYTTAEFVALISTYASHRTLDEDTRRRLHRALASTIDSELGGTVTKPYNCLLVLATADSEVSRPGRTRDGRRAIRR